jgi:aryl-alcohol dehydrogenase-like predicted oxidoreductase
MAKIRQRTIGNENVSVIGLGAMGMSSYYSGGGFMNNEDNNLKVLTDAADAGITFWDTRYIH